MITIIRYEIRCTHDKIVQTTSIIIINEMLKQKILIFLCEAKVSLPEGYDHAQTYNLSLDIDEVTVEDDLLDIGLDHVQRLNRLDNDH